MDDPIEHRPPHCPNDEGAESGGMRQRRLASIMEGGLRGSEMEL